MVDRNFNDPGVRGHIRGKIERLTWKSRYRAAWKLFSQTIILALPSFSPFTSLPTGGKAFGQFHRLRSGIHRDSLS